jgi:hypothetical protein
MKDYSKTEKRGGILASKLCITVVKTSGGYDNIENYFWRKLYQHSCLNPIYSVHFKTKSYLILPTFNDAVSQSRN